MLLRLLETLYIRNPKDEKTVPEATSISIVVLTLNEGMSIRRVLAGLRDQFLEQDVNVTVIDGNSTDETVDNAKVAGVDVIIQRTEVKELP